MVAGLRGLVEQGEALHRRVRRETEEPPAEPHPALLRLSDFEVRDVPIILYILSTVDTEKKRATMRCDAMRCDARGPRLGLAHVHARRVVGRAHEDCSEHRAEVLGGWGCIVGFVILRTTSPGLSWSDRT